MKARVLPGKKITDHQVQKYKHHHLKLSQAAAAAKAGISERSARRIEHSEALPSQREKRAWRSPLRGSWLDHRSPADAYGLTRSACQTAI